MKASELEPRLDEMDFAELQMLKHLVEQKIAARAKQERKALLDTMNTMAKERGFAGLDALLKAEEGGSAKAAKPRKSIAPKYRNPLNPDQTWTGRGRKPKWVEEMLAAGGSLDEALIDMPQAA